MTRAFSASGSVLAGAVVASLAIAFVAPTACSSVDGVSTSSTGPASGGAGGQGQGGDLFGGDTGCQPGQACADGGVCTDDGTCCAEVRVCGATCCEGAAVCSFETCVTPGNVCVDAADCGPDEYCDYGLGEPMMGQGGAPPGCVGGVELPTGKCLPKPPQCGPDEDPGEPATCLEACAYHPPPGQFDPVEKFGWGVVGDTTHDVMMAPIVTQLDDDNCDGTIDERDIPDIVFFTFDGSDYNNNAGDSATLRAISIVEGVVQEKWATKTDGDEPGRSIAAGDLDPSKPGSEIVVCASDTVRAYDALGNVIWTSQSIGAACFMPSIADMDQNGDVEVVVKGAILDGLTGVIETPIANTENIVVSDIDGDGLLDVVGSTKAWNNQGVEIVSIGITGTHPAVGDLDNDGVPEVVTVDNNAHSLSVWHVNPNAAGGFEIIRQGVDMNATIPNNPCCVANPTSAGCTRGGGPPTIADFNGDGFPDVGLAGGIGYVVFDGADLMTPSVADVDTIAWLTLTQDCSSAQTGSSVFDFDGDGSAEVVYADEETLRIYDGTTGDELFSTCNTSGTLWEYPLVADVDSDGQADIVVASNWYASGLNCDGEQTTGVRVFGDNLGAWVRTRRIWNQHAYHVTNINEDGTVPTIEPANYLQPGLNNFRQNVQPLGEFSAPDLVVSVAPNCGAEYTLVARVRNIGEASVPEGVVVGFYQGDPDAGGTKLGEALTTRVLYSLNAEDVVFQPPSQPTDKIFAVVDDGMPIHAWHECRDDNNKSAGADPDCGPN